MSFPTQLPTHTCLFISSSSSSAEKFLLHICKDKFPAILSSSIPRKVGFYSADLSLQRNRGMKWTSSPCTLQSSRRNPLHTNSWLLYNVDPKMNWRKTPFFCFDCSNAVPLTNECFLRSTNWALISASAVNPTFLPLTLTVSHTRLPCLVHHLNIALYPDTFLVWLSSTCFSQLSLEFILQLWFYTPPDTTSKHSPSSLGH